MMLLVLIAPIYAGQYLLHLLLPTWLALTIFAYCLCVLIGVLLSLLISYRQLPGIRQRQQWRIFVGGILIACLPTLLLTIFPLALGLSRFAVNGQVSTISFALLPLALGYSLLRYQLMLLETAVRRVISLLLSVVLLALVSYLALIVSISMEVAKLPALPIMAVLMAVGCPLALWLAKQSTIRLFSDEMQHYHRLLAAPHLLGTEHLSLEDTARLFLQAASEALETAEIALFVLNQNRQVYTICPSLHDEGTDNGTHEGSACQTFVDWLSNRWFLDGIPTTGGALPPPVVSFLSKADRPRLLGEVLTACQPQEGGDAHREDADILLAPIRVQGILIAILIAGRREEPQPYGGPDLTVVEVILSRFAPVLGTARMLLDLQRAVEQQQEIDRLKDQFIMSASHELRTPLTAVQGYLALLNEHWNMLDEEQKRLFLSNAELGCEELATLVSDLMSASKAQSNIDRMQIAAVDLTEEVRRVLDIVDASFRHQERSILVDIPPSLMVRADSARLRQVIINLLGNALKYSPPGSPVEITGGATAHEATVHIRDYGNGIPPEAHHEIFVRFVRMERDMNSPVRGTGLGLAICKQYMEAMGGRIWVESTGEEGSGSLFILALPLSADGESSREGTP